MEIDLRFLELVSIDLALSKPLDPCLTQGGGRGSKISVTLRHVEPCEDHDLKEELGVDLDAPAVYVSIDNPLGWEGYRYDLFGSIRDNEPEAHHRAWVLLGGLDTPREILQKGVHAWRRRVYCPGIPIYVEARWHPSKGETLDLRGLEKDVKQTAVVQALRGVRLLREIERRGRPAGSTGLLQEDFHRQYVDAYNRLRARGIKRPSQEKIADQLLIAKRTIERYIARYGRPHCPC